MTDYRNNATVLAILAGANLPMTQYPIDTEVFHKTLKEQGYIVVPFEAVQRISRGDKSPHGGRIILEVDLQHFEDAVKSFLPKGK